MTDTTQKKQRKPRQTDQRETIGITVEPLLEQQFKQFCEKHHGKRKVNLVLRKLATDYLAKPVQEVEKEAPKERQRPLTFDVLLGDHNKLKARALLMNKSVSSLMKDLIIEHMKNYAGTEQSEQTEQMEDDSWNGI